MQGGERLPAPPEKPPPQPKPAPPIAPGLPPPPPPPPSPQYTVPAPATATALLTPACRLFTWTSSGPDVVQWRSGGEDIKPFVGLDLFRHQRAPVLMIDTVSFVNVKPFYL